MLEIPEADNALISKLLEALRGLPEVTADLGCPGDPSESSASAEREVLLSIRVAERPLALLVEIRKVLYPRDVRQALWQIRDSASRRQGDGNGWPAVPLLAAESISPGA